MTKTILCPTRGGQASYPNQERAASLAKERNADLIFLYVADVQFLDHTAGPKVVDIETELEEMGEFLLAMAIERAGKLGVDASGVVERGVFNQVLVETIKKHAIDTVVIGLGKIEPSSLSHSYLESIAREICRDTGVEVIFVQDGDIINTICEYVNNGSS